MPNNPTGTQIPLEAVKKILETGLPVVVDEAYYEFTGQTMATELDKYPNMMVLRTFSKWAGLAGLRVGYGLFPKTVAERLDAIKDPYCVNAAAVVAARESLKDVDYLMGNVKLMISERERLFEALSAIKYLKPYPSSRQLHPVQGQGQDRAANPGSTRTARYPGPLLQLAADGKQSAILASAGRRIPTGSLPNSRE